MTRALLALALLVAACSPPDDDGTSDAPPARDPAAGVAERLPVEFTDAELRVVLTHSPLPPVAPDPTNAYADDPRAAHLGRWLFFDPRLSYDETVSCATCHEPDRRFTDGRALAVGLAPLRRHAPTIVDVAHHRWFYWDGRRDTLWGQAVVPIEAPKEMGLDRMALVHRLHAHDDLRAGYEAVFGPLPDVSDAGRFPQHARPIPENEDHAHGTLGRVDGVLPEHDHRDDPLQRAWDGMAADDRDAVSRVLVNVGKALAAYERRLVSAPTPFDRFADGLRTGRADDLEALDASAQRGLALFVGEARCTLCHSGPLFSDLEFHDARVPHDPELGEDVGRAGGIAEAASHEFVATGPFSDAPDAPDADKVEFLIDPTGHEPHGLRGQFKTPTLRGVVATAPYMHQGQLADLDAVLEHYSTHANAPAARGHVERFFVPLDLSADERADLLAFLASLDAGLADPSLAEPPASPVP